MALVVGKQYILNEKCMDSFRMDSKAFCRLLHSYIKWGYIFWIKIVIHAFQYTNFFILCFEYWSTLQKTEVIWSQVIKDLQIDGVNVNDEWHYKENLSQKCNFSL